MATDMGAPLVGRTPTVVDSGWWRHPPHRLRRLLLPGDGPQLRRRRFGSSALGHVCRRLLCRDETP